MCGLAFSGKSTLARRIADVVGAPIVSLDAINRRRGLDGGKVGGMTDAQWEKTSQLAVEELIGLMQGSRPVVLDDTLSRRFLRDRYRLAAAGQGYDVVLVYVDTPLAIIEGRRRVNEGTQGRAGIEDAVFAHHRERFEAPAGDEAHIHLSDSAEAERWLQSLPASMRKS